MIAKSAAAIGLATFLALAALALSSAAAAESTKDGRPAGPPAGPKPLRRGARPSQPKLLRRSRQGPSDRLAVARDAVEEGVYLFAAEPLERLAADEDFERRDEATILLARARFGLGDPEATARLLKDYQEHFPKSTRLFLEATYWCAKADLDIGGRADTDSAERRSLLRSACEGLQSVIDESVDPVLLAGARLGLGVALYKAGSFEEALEAFRRARQLGVEPEDSARVQMYFGRTNLSLRNFAEAAGHFEALLRGAPESPLVPEARYWLGEAHYYLEEWEKAAGEYAAAHEAAAAGKRQLRVDSLYALGWAHSKLARQRELGGAPAGAKEAWSRAFESFDSLLGDRAAPVEMRDSAAFLAAEMLFRLERYREAAERLLPLTDSGRYPERAPGALYLLGKCRAELGQLDMAVRTLEDVLELKGGVSPLLDRRTRYALADALVDRGLPARARSLLEPLAARDRLPSIRAGALLKMARISRRAAEVAEGEGRKPQAVFLYADAYRRLLSIRADRAALAELSADEVAYLAARSAHDRAELELELHPEPGTGASREWFERAAAAYDAVAGRGVESDFRAKALASMARLETSRGDLAAAARAYTELVVLIEGNPDTADRSELELDARLGLADVECRLGRPGSAVKTLSPVLAREDLAAGRLTPVARYKTAAALFQKGEFEEARKGYESFLVDYPESELRPDALVGLGDCFYELGEPQYYREAAARYEKVLADFPEYALIDRVRLAAGDAHRNLGAEEDVQAALAHYRRLFRDGSVPELRARAGLEEAKLAHAAGRGGEDYRGAPALSVLDRAAEVGEGGEISCEIAEFRGTVLAAVGRFEEAAQSFGLAARSKEPLLRVRARHEEARAFFSLGRALGKSAEAKPSSGEALAASGADALRRAARGFTWVVYNSREAALRRAQDGLVVSLSNGEAEHGRRRDEAIFEGAEALFELASVEDAAGHRQLAARELEEAKRLLALSGPAAPEAGRRRAASSGHPADPTARLSSPKSDRASRLLELYEEIEARLRRLRTGKDRRVR